MTHRITWSAAGRRSLNVLPPKHIDAILAFAYTDLTDNPHRRGHPLRLELEGLHTARRGDVRIVYRIDDDENVVIIELVAARSDVYRSR